MNIPTDILSQVSQLWKERADRERFRPSRPFFVPFANYASFSYNLAATPAAAIWVWTFADDTNYLGRPSRSIPFWRFAASVATTNDVTNYWNITLGRITTAGAFTSISVKTTSSLGIATWGVISTNLGATLDTTANIGLYVSATKVSGPGNLSLLTPLVYIL